MAESSVQSNPESYRMHSDTQASNLDPKADLVDYVKQYAREKPEVAALWCLGVGFVLGWKLKPW